MVSLTVGSKVQRPLTLRHSLLPVLLSIMTCLTMASASFFSILVLFVSVVASTNSVYQTALVIATDDGTADQAVTTLQSYGMQYQVLNVPSTGTSLPSLETISGSNNMANFGLLIVISQVSYDYGGTIGWASALTDTQWNALYAYQTKYKVRMIQLNVYPGAIEGTAIVPGSDPNGCCDTEEQLASLIDTSFIPTAGLRSSPLSTLGLWHFPAVITDPTTVTPFLRFGTNSFFPAESVAGVTKIYSDGREEMGFFIGGGSWSRTTIYLGHVWFHWGYRGLYSGFRRVYLGTQVDDVFLTTDLHTVSPDTDGPRPRAVTGDFDNHITWQTEINQSMNPGSKYFIELAFNGNGNEIIAAPASGWVCPNSVVRNDQPAPPQNQEWVKPLGTGVDAWPAGQQYVWSSQCTLLDPLATYFQDTSKRDAFGWVSHTFTHEDLDNATFADAFKEITFNQQHATILGIDKAAIWSPHGLVPPAITGLHNGDALKAFFQNGITNVVGDDTRPALVNPINPHWPIITTVSTNGFAGVQISSRGATRIFYDCSDVDENVDEWHIANGGVGDIYDLLSAERVDQTKRLLQLRQGPFMFHQANLRVIDVSNTTINGITNQRSLLQMWVESIVAEFNSLVTWPMLTKPHDQLATAFKNRMTKDQCNPKVRLIYTITAGVTKITGFQVTATGNKCAAPIPVTLPVGSVTSLQASTIEQVGGDPLTLWIPLNGSAKTFTLTSPIIL